MGKHECDLPDVHDWLSDNGVMDFVCPKCGNKWRLPLGFGSGDNDKWVLIRRPIKLQYPTQDPVGGSKVSRVFKKVFGR